MRWGYSIGLAFPRPNLVKNVMEEKFCRREEDDLLSSQTSLNVPGVFSHTFVVCTEVGCMHAT